MNKFLILLLLLLLNNCGLSGTAFLGPTYTGITTGSAYHTSLSYGSGQFIKKITENMNDKKKFLEKASNKESNNKILLALVVDKIEISEILEPEPLP
ncbi:hypothetical protein IDH20_03250 [Pelagibacterales bacterium SAG-MED39]|nr:hypothetical protein [Pelagibacterales bacterium SAG-MED39]